MAVYPDYRRAAQAAYALLQRQQVDAPPVPVEALATSAGAQVRTEPFQGDISGMLFRDDRAAIIGVNSLHPRTRRRFTIAHELGHLLLHQTPRIHLDRRFEEPQMRDARAAEAVDPHEIEANRFAAELLMPKEFLLRDLADQPIGWEDDRLVTQLAARYRVSVAAMTIRLTMLGLLSAG